MQGLSEGSLGFLDRDVDIDAYLVYPEGTDGRKFIVYENFKTILDWNRSLFFGLAVGRLSDLIEYY